MIQHSLMVLSVCRFEGHIFPVNIMLQNQSKLRFMQQNHLVGVTNEVLVESSRRRGHQWVKDLNVLQYQSVYQANV